MEDANKGHWICANKQERMFDHVVDIKNHTLGMKAGEITILTNHGTVCMCICPRQAREALARSDETGYFPLYEYVANSISNTPIIHRTVNRTPGLRFILTGNGCRKCNAPEVWHMELQTRIHKSETGTHIHKPETGDELRIKVEGFVMCYCNSEIKRHDEKVVYGELSTPQRLRCTGPTRQHCPDPL